MTPDAAWFTVGGTGRGSARRPDEAGRHDLVFIGPGRLGYTWGPVGAMPSGLVT